MNKKNLVFIFFLLLVTGCSYFFIIQDSHDSIQESVTKEGLQKVQIEDKVYEQQTINQLEYVNIPEGNLQRLYFDYPLIIKKYLVNKEQFVKKGDALAIIDEYFLKNIIDKKRFEIEKIDNEINSVSNSIQFLSNNINFSKEKIKSNKELMEKQEAGLKYDHVTIEQFNLTKDNYIESQKKLNIEEMQLNEFKNKLTELKTHHKYIMQIYNQQLKMLEQKVIYSSVDGFIKNHVNIVNSQIDSNTELFLIEVSSERTIYLKSNNRPIESLYILFDENLRDLKFKEKNNLLIFNLPEYLNSTRSFEDISIVTTYFSDDKVLIIDPLFVYEDKYIWIVNENNELKMITIDIIGKHFNGKHEEWVVKPLKNIDKNIIKVVTNRLSNVIENEKVEI